MKKNKKENEWILFAESDWALAKQGRKSKKILYETLCFHCQQASEKAIKAVFVFYKINFPKTHDIEQLLWLVKETGIDVPKIILTAKYLTVYATITRYPDSFNEVDKAKYKKAVLIADKVLQWAKVIIEKKSEKLF